MEPMNLGSPVSNLSANQSQYLPSFLMGDTGATTPPRVSGLEYGVQNSPFAYPINATSMGNVSMDFGRSPLVGNSLFGGGYHHAQTPPLTNIDNYHNPNTPTARKNATNNNGHSQSGPPIKGLFDVLRNNQMAVNSSGNENNLSVMTSQSNYNDSLRVMCSPLGANMSPVRMGVSNTSTQLSSALAQPQRPHQNDFWITVFGFPSGAASLVLQHFQMFGTVVDKVLPPQNCNWMHIKYSARVECDKALQFNQKIIKNNLMVGVMRCTDPSVTEKQKEKENIEELGTSRERMNPQLRAMSQQNVAFEENGILVDKKKIVAHRSNGIIDKAIDLFFNW